MTGCKSLRIAALILLGATLCSAQNGGLLERALRGEARVIDLSHKLNAVTPAYGGQRDAFQYEKLSRIDRDG